MNFPPQSLEQLRQEYVSILKSDGRKKLGRRSLEVLKSMLENPGVVAVCSISKLAADYGVNSSVITRMAQKLGYEGFPALQIVFQQAINERKSYYSEQVKQFLERRNSQYSTHDRLPFERMVRSEWGNVMDSVESFDTKSYYEVVKLLETARNVFILGMRGNYPVAFYFAYYLKMLRSGVTAIDNLGNAIAESLVEASEGDLFFAMGVHPYTKLTVEACRVAHNKGMKVVVLTDSLSSPLGNEADIILLISAKSDSYFSSITASNLYVSTLLSELVSRMGADAVARLQANETLLHELDIEYQ